MRAVAGSLLGPGAPGAGRPLCQAVGGDKPRKAASCASVCVGAMADLMAIAGVGYDAADGP